MNKVMGVKAVCKELKVGFDENVKIKNRDGKNHLILKLNENVGEFNFNTNQPHIHMAHFYASLFPTIKIRVFENLVERLYFYVTKVPQDIIDSSKILEPENFYRGTGIKPKPFPRKEKKPILDLNAAEGSKPSELLIFLRQLKQTEEEHGLIISLAESALEGGNTRHPGIGFEPLPFERKDLPSLFSGENKPTLDFGKLGFPKWRGVVPPGIDFAPKISPGKTPDRKFLASCTDKSILKTIIKMQAALLNISEEEAAIRLDVDLSKLSK